MTGKQGTARLVVDRVRCEGHGNCEASAPDVIHLDDDAEPVIDVEEVDDLLREQADGAVRGCPVAALRLVETT